jgi:DNA recombination protein RmuC
MSFLNFYIEPEWVPYLKLAIAGFVGLLLGLFIQYLIGRAQRARLEGEIALKESRIENEEVRATEREAALDGARDMLANSFNELAHSSLEKNSETFLRLARENFDKHQEKAQSELSERQQAVEHLVKPIQDALTKTHKQIESIENSRKEAYGGIKAQLEQMGLAQESLRAETSKLVSSLRQPNVRGQWGELTLRRLAELAGMVDRCDFAEQVHTKHANSDVAARPDMIIHLPEDGQLVVDVKTPLDAYLDAMEATDDESRKQALQLHARRMADHVRKLSSKAYYEQFDTSPEFVILFVPGDQFLTAALDVKPDLLEDALRQKVLLITPTSFVALLKVIAYGWMQLKLSSNTAEIRDLAVELHGRLGAFSKHLATSGRKLNESVVAYNKAVGSLESRVLPSTRRFGELGVDSGKTIETPLAIDLTARGVKPVVAIPDASASDNDLESEAS